MAGLPGLIIRIGADTKDAVAGIQRVNSELGKGLTGGQKFKASVDKAFLPAVAAIGALVAVGQDFARQAAEDAAAADVLANALRNTTGATDKQVAAVEDWITAQGKLVGVADTELRPSLQILASATGSVTKAQELATLAMDVAAQTGKPLETVSSALAKAYTGNTTALSRLVPGLDATTLKSKDMAKIQAELALKTKGAAKAAADAEGSTKRNTVALAEAQEEIGKRLLPIMTKFNQLVAAATKWVSENTTVVLVLAGILATLAVAIIAVKTAMVLWDTYNKIVTASQWLLNTALLANPLTWIVLAIVAVVAALVLLYNKNEAFRDFIVAAWAKIQSAFAAAFNWVKENWPLLLGILTGPIGFAVIFISRNWDKIKKLFEKTVSWFSNIGKNIVEGIKNGISTAWNGLKTFFTDKIEGLVGGVKNLLGIASPSKVFRRIGEDVVAGWELGIAPLAIPSLTIPTVTGTATVNANTQTGGTMTFSDEQLARALAALLLKSDLRNGRTQVVI